LGPTAKDILKLYAPHRSIYLNRFIQLVQIWRMFSYSFATAWERSCPQNFCFHFISKRV